MKRSNTTAPERYVFPGAKNKRNFVAVRARNQLGWLVEVEGGGKVPRKLQGRFLKLELVKYAVEGYNATVEEKRVTPPVNFEDSDEVQKFEFVGPPKPEELETTEE